MKRISLLAAGIMLLKSSGLLAQSLPEVTLHYYERPPFMSRHADGSAEGLTADRARLAFVRSGVPFHWALTPAKRQLALLQANSGRDCAVGWLRNPQRQAYALFSDAIYQDKAAVMILRSQLMLPAGKTLAQILDDSQLHILLKEGLTYGNYVQSKLASARAVLDYTTMDQPQLLHMVMAGRTDAMFATQEEAEMLLASSDPQAGLKMQTFPDALAGDTRHIMCSRNVGDAVIKRLNSAIAEDARVNWSIP